MGRGRLTPYLLLLPGGLWLLVFFAIPMAIMLSVSLQEGSVDTGFALTWNFGIYPEVITEFGDLFVRSAIYALLTTVLTLLIGFPMAYTIAFHGGRLKTALLFVVILPFFVSSPHDFAGTVSQTAFNVRADHFRALGRAG